MVKLRSIVTRGIAARESMREPAGESDPCAQQRMHEARPGAPLRNMLLDDHEMSAPRHVGVELGRDLLLPDR